MKPQPKFFVKQVVMYHLMGQGIWPVQIAKKMFVQLLSASENEKWAWEYKGYDGRFYRESMLRVLTDHKRTGKKK